MNDPINSFQTGVAGAGQPLSDVVSADGQFYRFCGRGATWLAELQALADRHGCGVSADMATMSCTELWALYGFLKAKAGRE